MASGSMHRVVLVSVLSSAEQQRPGFDPDLTKVESASLRRRQNLRAETVTLVKLSLYKASHQIFFLFSSCCLAGRAYPLGDIPEDLVPLVKNQVSIIFSVFPVCTS